ncbi:lipocalin family protein [Aliiroseovarius subalbicans]|uniref:lipocalin family protein n=1 Tax=Aliiroseovarius subalbicans TaxID=2925840 RepID=UPI001F5846D8|nr:lipocalin family protein [Aliiroseovarius subalbicans]MCI2398051.1 lipocalin family protein [Aliiroseovarius subalbicans]
MFALLRAALIALLVLPASAQAASYRDKSVPITVSPNLDLTRYLGKWYEIARFPNRFEKGCVGVTAEYAMRSDGKVRVLNTCRKGTMDGEVQQAEGQAKVVAPGKLSVTFVPWLPFAKGDYWVLYVDDAHSLAVVGEPKGRTGWILARDPAISTTAYDTALQVLIRNGYDTSKLLLVEQGQ